MTPLRFVRELACVDARLRPLRRPECRDYRPLRADGFSIHPYGFSLPPDGEPELPGNLTMGRLPRLAALLEALERRGRLERPLPLYVTELAWESNPPDPYRGVALDLQARYLSQSMAIAWADRNVRMTAWYLLRDIPPDAAVAAGLARVLADLPDRPRVRRRDAQAGAAGAADAVLDRPARRGRLPRLGPGRARLGRAAGGVRAAGAGRRLERGQPRAAHARRRDGSAHAARGGDLPAALGRARRRAAVVAADCRRSALSGRATSRRGLGAAARPCGG